MLALRRSLDVQSLALRRCLCSRVDELETFRQEVPKYTKIQGWSKDGDPNIAKLNAVFSPIGKSERNAGSVVVLEGKRLILDALHLGLRPKEFLFSQLSLLKSFPLRRDAAQDVSFFHTPYKLMERWSSLTTPTGIMASFIKEDILHRAAGNENTQALPLILILDNVRNPDNMGVLLRSAVASGVSKILTTSGCVDVWNDKCVRGGCGAHLMLPIVQHVPWSTLHRHIPRVANVALADIHRGSTQEEGGLSLSDVRKAVENLAAECASEYYETEEAAQGGDYVDASYAEEHILACYEKLPVPATEYWNFTKDCHAEDTILLIGGETEGISPQARKFVLDRNGTKYYIPLLNGMESLNVGVAASILLFEIQKSYKDFIEREK